jgi:hypothetical protein
VSAEVLPGDKVGAGGSVLGELGSAGAERVGADAGEVELWTAFCGDIVDGVEGSEVGADGAATGGAAASGFACSRVSTRGRDGIVNVWKAEKLPCRHCSVDLLTSFALMVEKIRTLPSSAPATMQLQTGEATTDVAPRQGHARRCDFVITPSSQIPDAEPATTVSLAVRNAREVAALGRSS